MRVGDVIEKWRQTRPLALEFGGESIRLMVLDPHGVWLELGAVTLTSDAFNENVQALARHARDMVGGASVELWLPRDQILSDEIALEAAGPLTRRSVALQLLAERTGAPARDIAFDIARMPDGKWSAAAADRRVAAEAMDYARRWGFAPLRVTTRHAGAAFPKGPELGAAPLRKAAPYAAAVSGLAAFALASALLWPAPAPAPTPEPQRIVLTPTQEAPAPTPDPPAPKAAPAPAPPAQTVTPPEESEPPDAPAATDLAEAPEPTSGAAAPRPEGALPSHTEIERGAPPAFARASAAPTAPALFTLIAAPDLSSPFLSVALSAPGAPAFPPKAAPPRTQSPAAQGGAQPAAPAQPIRFAAVDPAALTADVPPPVFRRYAGDSSLAPGDAPAPPGRDGDSGPGREPPLRASTALSGEAATIDEIQGPVIALAPAAPIDASPRSPLIEQAPPPEQADDGAGVEDGEEPDETDENPGAVSTAPTPRERPRAVVMSGSRYAPMVSAAPTPRPPSIKPRVRPLEAKPSQIVAAPLAERPSSPAIARAATVKDAIDLAETSLLGVFGKPNSRRAIVRLPSGEVRRVGTGESLEGWTVTSIGAASMKMRRGGETRSLKLVQ